MINKLFEILKINYKTILKVIFGLFILYYVIFFLTPKVKIAADQKRQLDSLNTEIKKIHQDNLKLEKKISEFNNEIEKIDQSINNIKNQKTIVKEYYHEKISNIDRLTSRQVDSFFTDRYK